MVRAQVHNSYPVKSHGVSTYLADKAIGQFGKNPTIFRKAEENKIDLLFNKFSTKNILQLKELWLRSTL